MQAIEFEATTFQHTIRVPDSVPDGVKLRVLLLVDDKATNTETEASKHWKNLLGSMPDVGSDEDFARPLDYGRDQVNDKGPDYLTMKVDDIEIPERDERYER